VDAADGAHQAGLQVVVIGVDPLQMEGEQAIKEATAPGA
jgi:hypothetical protein